MNNSIIECLLARRKTIKHYLDNLGTHEANFSDWKYESVENLNGRLAEIENTFDMLRIKY